MYNIYADGVLIHHSQSPDSTVKVIEPKLKRSDNAAGSLTFKVSPSNPGYELIKRLSTEIVVKRVGKTDGQTTEVELWAGRVIDETKDFWNNRSFTCEGELGYLNDTSQPPAEYHNITVSDFLKTLLNIHNQRNFSGKGISITFNSNSRTENNLDYVDIYYRTSSGLYCRLRSAGTIGAKTINIPISNNTFWIYWHTDASVENYWGWKIDSIRDYTGSSYTSGVTYLNALPSYTAVEKTVFDTFESEHDYSYGNNVNVLYKVTIPSANKHAFQLGNVTVTDKDATGVDSLYRYTNFESTLDCIIDKLVKRLGGHLRVRKESGVRYLDYLEDYPSENTQTIEFGKNLVDFTRNWDMKDLATVVVPLGCNVQELGLESSISALEEYLTVEEVNNNSIYVKSDTAIEEYGWIETVVHWDDVTQPTNLLTKAKKYLEEIQFEEMVLELTAVDMHYFDVNVEAIDLLDTIRCISIPHGMDKSFPITEIDIPLDRPDDTTFTLGNTEKSTRGISASIRSTNSSLQDAINRLPSSTEVLIDARTHADELINMKTNGFITISSTEDDYGSHSEAMYISDNKDLNYSIQNGRYWVWNSGGLAYYNKNAKTSANPSGLKTAITMDGGIYGDFLKVGTISSVYGGQTVSSWNLETGAFQTKNGTFTGTISGSVIVSGTYGTNNYTRIEGSKIQSGYDANGYNYTEINAGSFRTTNGTFTGTISGSVIVSGTYGTANYTRIAGALIQSGYQYGTSYTEINAGAFKTTNGTFIGTITGSNIYGGSYPNVPYTVMGSDAKFKSIAQVDVSASYGYHKVETGIEPGRFYSYIDDDIYNGISFENRYYKKKSRQQVTVKGAILRANNFRFLDYWGNYADVDCGEIYAYEDIRSDGSITASKSISADNLYGTLHGDVDGGFTDGSSDTCWVRASNGDVMAINFSNGKFTGYSLH